LKGGRFMKTFEMSLRETVPCDVANPNMVRGLLRAGEHALAMT
jgi:hypothetical protein